MWVLLRRHLCIPITPVFTSIRPGLDIRQALLYEKSYSTRCNTLFSHLSCPFPHYMYDLAHQLCISPDSCTPFLFTMYDFWIFATRTSVPCLPDVVILSRQSSHAPATSARFPGCCSALLRQGRTFRLRRGGSMGRLNDQRIGLPNYS